MKLSVIIPAFNEENTIRETIEKVQKIPIDKEIIIIDDGSTNGTLLRVISFAKNKGKGEAIKEGFKNAKGDYAIIQDADLEYNPEEYLKLLQPILDGKVDVVFGSRLLRNNPKGDWFAWLGRISLSWITNFLYGSKLTDIYTCYKLFPRAFIQSLNLVSTGFEIEAELTAKTLLAGKRIMEVPISYNPRTRADGKKICWIDWIKGIKMLLKLKYRRE